MGSKKWMEPLGLFANFYKGRGKANDWKFKSLIGSKNAMIMSGNFGLTLLKADSRCGDKSKPLGTASTEMQCAESCFTRSGCKFFRYNKKNGQCYFELTQKRDCPLQGFKPMKGFGFYEVSAGPSLSGTGPRMMTTRPFDARNGGNVAFDIVLGEENGYGKCWPTFQKMVAKEKERMQRKQKMLDAKASCESGKACNGHGTGNDARMGVIGSFGPSLVTSSTWKCIDKLDANDTVGNAWMKSNYDDSKWPSAPEEGDNGVLPWGPRPGIAKKAKWIFTHDSYKMKGKKAYCRVNVKNAWHSYSKTHPEASRWSCKQQRDRQSPFVTQLNSETFVSVEIKSGKAASEYQTPDPSKNSFIICKVIRKWNAKTVTFKTAPAYDGPASKCRTVRPSGKNNWVAIDVSEWMREWVTNPKENFGMMLFPPGGDNVGFVSQLDPDAN